MGTHRTRQGLGNTLLLVVQLAEGRGDRADDLAAVRARKRRRPEVKHDRPPASRGDAASCTTGRMPGQAGLLPSLPRLWEPAGLTDEQHQLPAAQRPRLSLAPARK